MYRKVELLAPAGTFDALKAAVEAGANAVYLAGSHFGARAYAGNFNNDELAKAVEFAHLRNVEVHVTVNTIVSNDEIDELKKYLKFLSEINVDAILVQDLGVASIAIQTVPEMMLHASTQMTVHSLEGVKVLEMLGFDRVVLSREMSLDEIRYICANANAEIEVFMHGALCVCYSGQCLMSSMIGARSGNRGQCAQPCRLPYELIDESGHDLLEGQAGKYLLSPKDLNTIDLLPQLIQVGVSSLKIEGRMKRPEYVATVVETYRNAIDRYYKNPSEYKAENTEKNNLAQIFNRDFTTAYLEKNQGRQMISDMKPNNRGLLIGRVAAINKNSISIKVTDKINIGDQFDIWVKVGGRVAITVNDFKMDGDICTVKIDKIGGVKIHDRVFKVFDSALTAHAREFFNTNTPVRRINIDVEVTAKLNEPLHLTMTDIDGNTAEVTSKIDVAEAKNQPLTYELIYKQISRLGNTIFNLRSLNVNIADNVMIPISELNDMRRRAADTLNNLRLSKFFVNKNSKCIDLKNNPSYKKTNKTLLVVAVDNIEMLKAAADTGADSILFGGESYRHEVITPELYQQAIDIAHNEGKKIYIATPRIVRQNEQSELENILNAVSNADAVYVHNIATLILAGRLTKIPIHTDFSLITFNTETIKMLYGLGAESITLSPELTLEQVKSIAKKSLIPLECIVHGRLELMILMISQYCAAGSFIGGVGEHVCSQPCKRQKMYLRDRKSAVFPIVTDQFCRMHILNSKTLSMLPHVSEFAKCGVDKIRIDGRYMSKSELVNTIKKYRLALSNKSAVEDDDITRGHYFRGVTNVS